MIMLPNVLDTKSIPVQHLSMSAEHELDAMMIIVQTKQDWYSYVLCDFQISGEQAKHINYSETSRGGLIPTVLMCTLSLLSV